MKPKIFTFNLALFLFAVAFLATGLRQFEAGHFQGVAVAGLGLTAVAVVGVVRFRNALDRKAVTK